MAIVPGIVLAVALLLLMPTSPRATPTPSGWGASCAVQSAPPAARSPIQHVVWIVKENHALENYFGALPGVTGYPPNASLPSAFGSNASVRSFPLPGTSTPDLPHDRASELIDLDGGRNDLFVAEARADGALAPEDAVGYYTSSQIPAYYRYAETFALGDHYFTGVLGPTDPNRFFDLTAASGNWTQDGHAPAALAGTPSILGQLESAGLPWAYDYAGSPTNLTPFDLSGLTSSPCALSRMVPMSDLTSQLYSADPPALLMVDPSHDLTISEHPPGNVSLGAAWTAGLVNAIAASPIASSTVVLISWDEAGGFWDPVVPPDLPPTGDGFRVPLLVISPWTSPGIVHQTVDPASVLQWIDANWGLPYLNARVAGAYPLSPFFDFSRSPRALPQVSTNYSFNRTTLLGTVAPAIGGGPPSPLSVGPQLATSVGPLTVRAPSVGPGGAEGAPAPSAGSRVRRNVRKSHSPR